MTAPQRLLIAGFAALSCHLAIAGPTPAPVRAEIDALLGRLQSSGCQFNRNGSWYSGADAKSHLLRKLEYFEGKTTLRSAEEFIELAATASSSSGKVYQVKCDPQPAVESRTWLTQQLTQLRHGAATPR